MIENRLKDRRCFSQGGQTIFNLVVRIWNVSRTTVPKNPL